MYEFIDCQGFAGGFTLGMVQAGFELIGKREKPGGFGMANCLANRHMLGTRWDAEVCEPDAWTARPAQVVIGNPPCSGFSVVTTASARGIDAKINQCMWDFVRFAARCNPVVAAFESVRSAFSIGQSLMVALRDELERLTGNEYTLYHVMHNAYELGGVAVRPRYFWVASRVPFGVEFPALGEKPVLWDAIGDLENLSIQWEAQPYRDEPTGWSRNVVSHKGTVDGHMTARNNPHMLRIHETLKYAADVDGWREGETVYAVLRRMYEANGYVPPLFAPNLDHMLSRDWRMGFISPLRWYKGRGGRVIDGASLYRAIHPTLDRTITHREAARVMGYPDDWAISTIKERVTVLEQTWGKGITVHCGRWLGKWIDAALEGEPGTVAEERLSDRQYLVKRDQRRMVGSFPQARQTAPNNGVNMPRRRPTSPVEGEPEVTQEAISTPDANPVEATVAENGAETASRSGRGRPRPQHTMERDQKVLAFLNVRGGVWTVKALVDELSKIDAVFAQPIRVKHCLDRLGWGDGTMKEPRNPYVLRLDRNRYQSAALPPQEPVAEESAAAPATPADVPQEEPQAELQDTTATWQ